MAATIKSLEHLVPILYRYPRAIIRDTQGPALAHGGQRYNNATAIVSIPNGIVDQVADNPLLPALAIQIYAHQTHEYDRCIAHLRNRFHLREGHELEGSQVDAVLALAQILNDKGDVGAGRRLAMQVLEMIERMQPAAPAGVFSSNTYRG